VAFSGKRQYLELLNADPSALPPSQRTWVTVAPGGQGPALARPQGSGPRQGGRGGGGGSPKKAATVDLGPQARLPRGWPLPASTEVWVLTSTSGASALTNEQRSAPYQALAARLGQVPWPRDVRPACVAAAAAASDGGAAAESGGGGLFARLGGPPAEGGGSG
jgi:hypothetical protein